MAEPATIGCDTPTDVTTRPKVASEEAPTLSPDPGGAVATVEAAGGSSRFTPLEPDSLLGSRYRLVREIGRGGFGVVWLAEDTRLNRRRVAIKMLEGRISADAEAIEAMRHEAAIALELTHPRIVRLHIFDVDGPHAFLVFEYLAGPTLSEIIRARRWLSLRETLLILHQVGEALTHIHNRGIVHCDIKPGNIMLEQPLDGIDSAPFTEETCSAKLTDMGISRALSRAAADPSQPIMGTPSHMAPELIQGQTPSPASEIYSLSCVLYQMLVGSPPFTGDDVVYHQINSDPREIPDVPPAVNDVVLRGLAKRPQDRWSTVDALVTAFQAACDEACEERPAPPPDPATLEEEVEGPLCMPLRLNPGGTFLMGSTEDDPDHQPHEGPVHAVTLKPFRIGKFPVTVSEYEAFLWQTQHRPPHQWEEQRKSPRRPIVYVSWADATAFCVWMSKIGKRPFRLPTEAEWECSARGGLENRRFPWGDESPENRALFNPNIFPRDASHWYEVDVALQEVGQFDPNDLGLHDTAGLVAEWCSDNYRHDYYGKSPDHDPPGASTGGRRVLRGGSWRTQARHLRCASRLMLAPGSRCPDFGFRVVCEV